MATATLCLGFVLSMVMAPAPLILPAVLRRQLPYHPLLIAPVVLLHLSLAVRLWLGDALGVPGAWQAGGERGRPGAVHRARRLVRRHGGPRCPEGR